MYNLHTLTNYRGQLIKYREFHKTTEFSTLTIYI